MKKTFLIGFLAGVIVVGGFEIAYWQKAQSDIITVQVKNNLETYIADFEKDTVEPLETQIADFYAFMKDKKVGSITKPELIISEENGMPNLQTSVIMDLPELHEKEVSIYWPNLDEAQDAAFPIFVKGKGRNVFKNSEFQVDVYYMKDGNKRKTNLAFATCNFDGNLCSDDSHDLLNFRATLNLENSPVCDLFMDLGPVGRKSDKDLYLEKVPLKIYNAMGCNPVVEEVIEEVPVSEEEVNAEAVEAEVSTSEEVVVEEEVKTEEVGTEAVEAVEAPTEEKVEVEKKEEVKAEEKLEEVEVAPEAKPEEREAVKKFPWN